MNTPIRTEKEYKLAMDRLEIIFEAKKGTKEGAELERLGILIAEFENEYFLIGKPDPIEAIKFRQEQLEL